MLSSVCLASASTDDDGASSSGLFSGFFSGKKMHAKKMHDGGMHTNRMHSGMHTNRTHTGRDLGKALQEAEARIAQGSPLKRRDSFRALEEFRGPNESMTDVNTPGASSKKMLQELKDAKDYAMFLERDNNDLQRQIRDLWAMVDQLDAKNEELTDRLIGALESVGRQ